MGTLIDCWSRWTVGRRMGTKMIFTSFSSSFFFFAATHAFPSGPLSFNPSMVRQDGPLNMEALNMLHADAVKFGAGAKDNKWFEAVDAKTLDGMITEMNTMNRWFAKVVKYWVDFTSGGDGAKVLAEQGKGINEDEPVDGDVGGDDEPATDGKEPAADGEPTDGEPTDGEPTDGEPADGEDKPAADGKDPAADGDGEPAADGDGEPTDGEDKPADGEDEPAGGDEKPAADGDEEPADGGEDEEGGDDAKTDDKEADARKRRMKKRRMRKRL